MLTSRVSLGLAAAALLAVVAGGSPAAAAPQHPDNDHDYLPAAEYVSSPRTGDLDQTDASYNYGWVTGTLYLNRTETAMVKNGSAVVVAACGLMPTPANVACAASILAYAGTANYAYERGGCLKIKHSIAGNVWPDTHYGDRCT